MSALENDKEPKLGLSALENDRKPKLRFSITQLLHVYSITLQYWTLNVCFWEWQILLKTFISAWISNHCLGRVVISYWLAYITYIEKHNDHNLHVSLSQKSYRHEHHNVRWKSTFANYPNYISNCSLKLVLNKAQLTKSCHVNSSVASYTFILHESQFILIPQ